MNQASDRSRTERDAIARSLVSEIWLLVDFVAGSSRDRLNKVVVLKPDGKESMTPSSMLNKVSDIEDKLDQGTALSAEERTFLQTLRDALNSEIEPASGLTVAYSSLVAGPYRNDKASRATMAEHAYERLGETARSHRTLIKFMFAIGVLVTFVAVWESSKVALGRALLDNMALLRNQQAALDVDKFRAEVAQGGTANLVHSFDEKDDGKGPPITSYRLCNRAMVRLARDANFGLGALAAMSEDDKRKIMMPYGSPEERDLCGRDDILRVNIDVLHTDLNAYKADWTAMVGSVFAAPSTIWSWLTHKSATSEADTGKKGLPPVDNEFQTAPVLLVWGNLILPIIFGLIGSCISVLLDFYNKLKCSQLHPNDRFLAPIRLGMGAIVGACVGLFYSGTSLSVPVTAPVPGAVLLSSLTLTASGVAFLAGFGVEAVFGMLQMLLGRVFPNKPDGAKPT